MAKIQYDLSLNEDKTAFEVAQELVAAGYLQVSRRFGIVARPDVPDVESFLLEEGYHSSVASRGIGQYCRVYSQDWIEGVPDSVMAHVRKFGAVAH